MLRRINLLRSIPVAMALAIFSLNPAYAQTAPVVKAQIIRDFARISFEWPREVRIKAGTTGKSLQVTFEQPATVNAATILRNLNPYITNVQKSDDGRTFTFSMNQAYKIRSFVSSNVNGVDILGVGDAPASAKITPPPPAEKPKTVVAEKATPEAVKPEAQTPEASKLPFQVVKAQPKPTPAPDKKIALQPVAKPLPKSNPALQFAKAPRPLLKAAAEEKSPASVAPTTPPPVVETTPPPVEKIAKPPVAEVAAPAVIKQPEVAEQTIAPTVAAPVEEQPIETPPPPAALTSAAIPKALATEELTEEASAVPAPPAIELPSATANPEAVTPEAIVAEETTTAEGEPKTVVVPEIPDAPSAAPAAAALDEDAAKTANAAAKLAAPLTPPAEVAQQGPLVVTAEVKDNKILIHFPWTQRVAVAAFRRGDHDYLLFNKPVTINLDALQGAEGIETATTSPLEGNTLVMLQTPLKGLIIDKAANEYAWHVQLSDAEMPPLHPIRSIPSTAPPLKPHVLLTALEIADGIALEEPFTGDNLIVVPSYHVGDGIYPLREFIEFDLLPTAQGVVVKPKAENLRVTRLRNGMKITSPEGLLLSKDLPALAASELLTSIDGDGTLFPYLAWKTPEGKNLFDFANEIQQEIPFAPSAQKNAFRLRLAQLYLAEERPQDAIALLELIEREAPDFFTQNRLNALRGAADFLTYRYQEAYARFADEALNDIPEIELWRDTLMILLTSDGRGNYSDYNKNFVSKYPPYMAVRLGFAAADLLIGRGQFNKALRIFDTLSRHQLVANSQDDVDYQVARVSAGTAQKDVAKKIWETLSTSPDNFIRSRSIFALTNMLLRDAKIDIPEALKRLEPLRIMWRGDDFELGLLQFIGDLYEANNQPREALRAYREVVQFFPNNAGNQDLLAKMADMFVTLFNGGAADKLTPLEALALYYEFRDLTPVENDGDKMVRNLADRLVSVDLLDRAAALLEHQVRFRLAGEDRSRVGAQLALIYLLNHQPKQALQALELTGYGQNPEDLQHSRVLLTARALADLKETNRAIALLDGDTSKDAGQLRLGIHWDEKDWKNVITTGEALMGQRKDPAAAITPDESTTLLRLALAYVFERQTEQVQYLRDYFLPLMKGSKDERLFEFITQDAPVDYRNLAQLTSHLNNVENFLATYRTKMQKEGLSKVIP